MRRRVLLLLVVFAATRLLIGFLADHPEAYPDGSADATADVANYRFWAEQSDDHDQRPYRDFHVGYPPAALPLADIPYAVDPGEFRRAFILESIALDALGLWAIYRVARRREQWWGVVAWLVMLPLLGPVAYTRLDMAVAACLAWALERVDAGRWTTAAIWLGIGAAVKVTPALLLPVVALAAPKRWRTFAAGLLTGCLFLLPHLEETREIIDQVLTGNVDRGIHAESIWGSLILLGRVMGVVSVTLIDRFGATDVVTTIDGPLQSISNAAAFAVLFAGIAAVLSRVRRGDGAHLVLVAGAVLMLTTSVGRVFSPQYLAWAVPVMAVALAITPRRVGPAAVLLGVSVALAHLLYPVLFWDYLAVDGFAVVVGLARNLALLASGLLLARAAWRYEPDGDLSHVTAEQDHVGGPHPG